MKRKKTASKKNKNTKITSEKAASAKITTERVESAEIASKKVTTTKASKKVLIGIFSLIAIITIGVIFFTGNKTIEFPPYTEEFKGQADLVDVEGYMFSELYNSSKEKTYYRFKINQNNKDSVDIEVTDLDCFVSYADNTDVDYKEKLGKVEIYERTYDLGNSETIKRNVYKVYVLKDKVMEVSMND